ncbi:n-acetylglucosamine-6-phosphate deacetylase [Trichoderma arundinaceum]|uniref:N-acetylglucosamine-6-phosphate deacetylase n=1 Tax=Trichoderma arundinaceum TaxID=490622 RepID=A0A395NH75_TRIAR|nr:n-acetylglucosamine-6-phosphate deacetylase [Trichoderma arundinaceum]
MPCLLSSQQPVSPLYIKFINGRVVQYSELTVRDVLVNLDTGKICDILEDEDPAVIDIVDLKGKILAPGYIDVQINGAFGFDFSTADCITDPKKFQQGLESFNKQLIQTGTTSYLPTMTSQFSEIYHHALPFLGPTGASRQAAIGAESLGAHCEGPFFAHTQKGCHNPDAILSLGNTSEPELISKVYGPKNLCCSSLGMASNVKMVTLAPERAGALESIGMLHDQGIIASIGHTAATYEEAVLGVKRGSRMVTHLFNAMNQLHHREPGIFGLISSSKDRVFDERRDLADDGRPYFGIIADGIHLHPASIRLAYEAHPEGLILVTDAVMFMGMPDGIYEWTNGQRTVKEGMTLKVDGASTLAGSAVDLPSCVNNMMRWTGCSIPDAIKAVTATPAAMLGLSGIKVNRFADGSEIGELFCLEIGGSTLRVALVRLGDSELQAKNKAEVLELLSWPITDELKGTTGAKFMQWIARTTADFFKCHTNSKCGGMEAKTCLTWSFPFRQTEINRGTILRGGKGFHVFKELVGCDIGDVVRDAYKREGVFITIEAIINDTVAGLLAGNHAESSVSMSVVLGTGLNAAVNVPISKLSLKKMEFYPREWMQASKHVLVNTELSLLGAAIFPRTVWDLALLDTLPSVACFQPFEFFCSGYYIGEIVRQIIVWATHSKCLFTNHVPHKLLQPFSFPATLVSLMESDTTADLSTSAAALMQHFDLSHNKALNLKELWLIKGIAHSVSVRAAAYLAVGIHALSKFTQPAEQEMANRISQDHAIVGVSGALFEHLPGFKATCEKFLNDMAEFDDRVEAIKSFHLHLIKHGSIIGSALLAANILRATTTPYLVPVICTGKDMDPNTIENDSASQELSRIGDADQLLLFVERHKSPNRPTEASSTIVTAQLSGTFLRDSQPLRSGDRYILCYRRNLFQIRGTVIFDGGPLRSPFSSTNKPLEFRVILTAWESLNGNQVAIITVPKVTKESKASSSSMAPSPIILKIDNHFENAKPIAFSWPRLQFRTATAKGGRRKERGLEQYFEIRIQVLAVFQDCTETLVSEKKSVPIIVRGRSPGNFPSTAKMSPDSGEHLTHTSEPWNEGVGEVSGRQDWLPGYKDAAESMAHTSHYLICHDEMDDYDNTFSFAPTHGDQLMSNPTFLTQDFHISDDLISAPPKIISEDNESLNIDVEDCLCGDDTAQTSEHAPSKESTPSNDHQYDQGTTADNKATGSTMETRNLVHYEYIPLTLDDRTPPVQAIYVGCVAPQ